MSNTTTWPPPAPPRKPRTISGRTWAIVGAVLVGLAILGAATSKHNRDSTGPGGGSFSVAAGWDVSRAADLAVKIETDDGVSSAKADCAMKAIAYDTTWLEWQAMGSAGQFVAIRGAEAGC